MIVAAIVAAGVRRAAFSHLLENLPLTANMLALIAAAGALMAFSLGDLRGASWAKGLGAGGVFLAFVGLLAWQMPEEPFGAALGAYAYVAAWAAVRQLDGRRPDQGVEATACESAG